MEIPIQYVPDKIEMPSKTIDVPSCWKGLESIIEDILNRFEIDRDTALEFGVENGYSTVALSNFFNDVVAVDHFKGDENAGGREEGFALKVKKALSEFPNIRVIVSSFEDFIKNNNVRADLIHIDIVHSYESTFQCGLWSAQHSDITIFHDTESFPEVKQAVKDIAKQTGKHFYNYEENFGLGILV